MMELSGMDVDVTVLGLVGGVSGMDALAACKALAQAAVPRCSGGTRKPCKIKQQHT